MRLMPTLRASRIPDENRTESTTLMLISTHGGAERKSQRTR